MTLDDLGMTDERLREIIERCKPVFFTTIASTDDPMAAAQPLEPDWIEKASRTAALKTAKAAFEAAAKHFDGAMEFNIVAKEIRALAEGLK